MPTRILHLIDPTTSSDALEMLALLLQQKSPETSLDRQRVVGIGHHQTRLLAQRAGVWNTQLHEHHSPLNDNAWVPSLGWADLTGWRAIRRIIQQWHPTHIHAWGVHGVIATEVSRFRGTRLATFAELPSANHLKLLKRVDRRSKETDPGWHWIANSTTLAGGLIAAGLLPRRVTTLRPAINPDIAPSHPTTLRDDLGLAPNNHPVILLGCEGPHARHDHGLWSAAILQQIFPNTRAILREDVRGKIDPGLGRFSAALPNEDMLIIAPPELPWNALLSVADIFLVTADGPTSTGSILHAMASGIPIIATPTPELSELIQHNHNGLLANGTKPREIAAKLEEFMNDPTLGPRLAANAQNEFPSRFPLAALLEAYQQLHRAPSPQTLVAAP